MEASLINCPFCSAAARIIETHGAVYVRCTGCDAHGPYVWKEGLPPTDATRYAIEKWNRRGGIGHTTVSLANPNIPPETFKFAERVRNYLERLEEGKLGAPVQGFICGFDGKHMEVSKFRCSDLELNGMVAALVKALRTKFITTEKT